MRKYLTVGSPPQSDKTNMHNAFRQQNAAQQGGNEQVANGKTGGSCGA
jgi:hypothetical protein